MADEYPGQLEAFYWEILQVWCRALLFPPVGRKEIHNYKETTIVWCISSQYWLRAGCARSKGFGMKQLRSEKFGVKELRLYYGQSKKGNWYDRGSDQTANPQSTPSRPVI